MKSFNKMDAILFVPAIVFMIILVVAFCFQQRKDREAVSLVPAKSMYQVGLLQSENIDSQNRAAAGFFAGLAAKGFIPGRNITLEQQNGAGDNEVLSQMANRFTKSRKDIVLTIGTEATETILSKTKSMPVVAAAVYDFRHLEMSEGHMNLTGMTDFIPVGDQLDTAAHVIPIRRLGILFDSSNEVSMMQLKRIRQAASKRGISLYEVEVSSPDDIGKKAAAFIGHADAVYVPEDDTVAPSLAKLLAVTDPAGIPVIGSDRTMVQQGALISLSIDYYRLGFSAGEMAGTILQGKTLPCDIPVGKQQEYDIVVNMAQATRFHIKLPSDTWQKARKLYLYAGQDPKCT